jgi:glycosyltransferase involved in cell wall biosynthesis
MSPRGVNVFVDARMISSSGIGRFISGLLPRLSRQGFHFIAGVKDNSEASLVREICPEGETVPYPAEIYSVAEQITGAAVVSRQRRRVKLFWFPHYNVPWLLPANSIVSVHDLIHLKFPEHSGGRLKTTLARHLIRRALRRARYVVCPSTATRDDLMRLSPRAARKLRVVHYGVSDRFTPLTPAEQDAFRRRKGLQRLLLTVGNKKPHKNHRLLLDVVDRLAPEFPDVRLAVIGAGDRRWDEEVTEWKKSSQFADRLLDLEDVSDEELAAYYSCADVFLMPSRCEGFGLPPLEAMAAGTPVVSSGGGSLAEILGDSAITCGWDDADGWTTEIARLLKSEAEREELVRKGFEQANRYSWDTAARRFADLFREAVESQAVVENRDCRR